MAWSGSTPSWKKQKTKKPQTTYGNAGMFDTPVTGSYRRAGANWVAADPSNRSFEYTRSGQDAWLAGQGDIATGRNVTYPTAPGGGTSYGGGGGGGGRGGGGGGGALTQAIIDAMARAMGGQGPQLALQQANFPAFQGQNLPAFNAQPYTQALGQINTAQAADQANITQNSQQLQQTLQNNYSNPYAQAQVAPGAQAATQGVGLMGTVGGTASTQPAQQVNAQNADSQASFQNLLQVLAAADQQSQNSRMAQVPMDANYATQGLNAQALGMRGQVGMAQTAAQQQWAQQDAERRYQNSLMGQQWNREEAQTNWQANQASQQARLQPILDLIMQGNGRAGLNYTALFKALGLA